MTDNRLSQRYLAQLARGTIPRLIVPYAYSTHDAADLMGHSVPIDSTTRRVYGVVSFYEAGNRNEGKRKPPLTSRESSSTPMRIRLGRLEGTRRPDDGRKKEKREKRPRRTGRETQV